MIEAVGIRESPAASIILINMQCISSSLAILLSFSIYAAPTETPE